MGSGAPIGLWRLHDVTEDVQRWYSDPSVCIWLYLPSGKETPSVPQFPHLYHRKEAMPDLQVMTKWGS